MSLRFAVRALQLVVANCLIFVAYRWCFLDAFAEPASLASRPAVLANGLRLDLALLTREVGVVAVVALVLRRPRPTLLLRMLWVCTALNTIAVGANFLFFRERNQHVWESLLANLGQPGEVMNALEPFVHLHPLLFVAMFLGVVGLGVLARRHSTISDTPRVDVWWSPRALAVTAAVIAVCVAVNLERIPDKRRRAGYYLGATASKHYMDFPDYVLNQAVVNPMYDLLVHWVPALFVHHRYRLPADEALATSRALLELPPGDPHHPLLRSVTGDAGVGIQNMVLLQVEGLGTNVLLRDVAGSPVMPFVRELGAQGLLFPNIYQSFSATDGSTFAVTTGLHRTIGVSEGTKHFLPVEVNGLYGCLARVLAAPAYHHFFFAGFKQRIPDFLSFMGNQGYTALGYYEFRDRLGAAAEVESNLLGVFDGPMLREVATILADVPGRFTAYIATATSHSPWVVPADMPDKLPNAALTTFRYADQSIRAFVDALRTGRSDFDRTLFVIFGDHTSVTFGDGLTERIRTPVVLYSTGLARERARWVAREGERGSHVDILPTVLALLDGPHPFSGMGKSLLAPRGDDRGLISSSYTDSLFVRGDWALRVAPLGGEPQLFAIEHGEIMARDVAVERPDVVAALQREYLALYETSDRLVREKRVFPRGQIPQTIATAMP